MRYPFAIFLALFWFSCGETSQSGQDDIRIVKSLYEKIHFLKQDVMSSITYHEKLHMFQTLLKEIHLLRRCVVSNGLTSYKDNEDASKVFMETVVKPKLTSWLCSLHYKHQSFSATARLARRWICCHLLSDHIPEMVSDLLVAKIFLSPAPYSIPQSGQKGLLHFFELIATHNWLTAPLIVNFGQELLETDVEAAMEQFNDHKTQRPAMVIVTPADRSGTLFTNSNPMPVSLNRLVQLAKMSSSILQAQLVSSRFISQSEFRQIFRPHLESYDVLIHLRPPVLPRLSESVDYDSQRIRLCKEIIDSAKGTPIPVINFDPVRHYIREVTDTYSHFALFFHDEMGGSVIGVVFKPDNVGLDTKMKILNGNGHIVQGLKMVPNYAAMLEDLRILGRGIVSRVEANTEKWRI